MKIQALYLLWPGEVTAAVPFGKPDPALAKAVTDLGFDVVGEGRLPLYTQNLSDPDAPAKAQPVEGGAAYVTFVQYGGALGLSPPATWIQIPATPRLVDPRWLIDLRMPELVHHQAPAGRAGWNAWCWGSAMASRSASTRFATGRCSPCTSPTGTGRCASPTRPRSWSSTFPSPSS